MKIQSFLLAFLLLVCIAGSGFSTTKVTPTYAQEPTIDPTMLPLDTVFKKVDQPEKIQQLLDTYQGQVEQYRTLERAFTISKAQFFKLNTLQSLEEAVVSTKKVMISRTEVFITYFELLHASLQDTEGVDVTQKARILKNLEDNIVALKEHQKKITDTSDRAGIAERVAEFAVLRENLSPVAYSAIAVVIMGDLQTVYDKTVILYADIKKYHQENPTTALRQDERNRAYREVDIEIESINKELLAIRSTIGGERFTVQTFQSQTRTKLNTAYAEISQLHSFLDELILELT